MSPHAHAARGGPARVGVLTVSDTRTAANDESGDAAAAILAAAGHVVVRREIVPDEPGRIQEVVLSWLADSDCDAVITNGGTGIASRDRTCEAVSELLDRRLDGFGELFRMLSWSQVGSAAMLSRAVAGIARGKPLFAVPGSPAAVRLAVERLIAPELAHLLSELRRR